MKAKGLLTVFAILLISAIGFKGYAQPDEEEIVIAFRDAVNSVLYPEEIGPIPDLLAYEVEGKILPKASEVIAETISLVYKRTGEDIGVTEVFAVLPPDVEKVLLPKKEDIEAESAEILDNLANEDIEAESAEMLDSQANEE